MISTHSMSIEKGLTEGVLPLTAVEEGLELNPVDKILSIVAHIHTLPST